MKKETNQFKILFTLTFVLLIGIIAKNITAHVTPKIKQTDDTGAFHKDLDNFNHVIPLSSVGGSASGGKTGIHRINSRLRGNDKIEKIKKQLKKAGIILHDAKYWKKSE